MRATDDFDAGFWDFKMLGEGSDEGGISFATMGFGVEVDGK